MSAFSQSPPRSPSFQALKRREPFGGFRERGAYSFEKTVNASSGECRGLQEYCTYKNMHQVSQSGGGRMNVSAQETPRKLPAKRAHSQKELSVYEKTVGMLMKAGSRACEMTADLDEQEIDVEMEGFKDKCEDYQQSTTILDYFQRRHK